MGEFQEFRMTSHSCAPTSTRQAFQSTKNPEDGGGIIRWNELSWRQHWMDRHHYPNHDPLKNFTGLLGSIRPNGPYCLSYQARLSYLVSFTLLG